MMFQSTLPLETADLMRVSDFRRYLASLQSPAAGHTEAGGLHSRVSQLNPSLVQDLQRFERANLTSEGFEVLEVMAAAVRHGKRLLLHLQHERLVVPLTVFPAEHLVHCPLPVEQLLASRLSDLRVLQVEPALLHPPGSTTTGLAAPAERVAALGPVLWELALRGSREALLPEIAGNAAYRIAPGVDLSVLDLSGSLAAAVRKLRRQTTNLRDIAGWPGFDQTRATRLLNGLYLQAGLMVSRTHPAATNEGWTGHS